MHTTAPFTQGLGQKSFLPSLLFQKLSPSPEQHDPREISSVSDERGVPVLRPQLAVGQIARCPCVDEPHFKDCENPCRLSRVWNDERGLSRQQLARKMSLLFEVMGLYRFIFRDESKSHVVGILNRPLHPMGITSAPKV